MQFVQATFGLAWLLSASHAATTMVEVEAGASPIDKVILLMERLKGDIEKEGKEEAAGYDKFACFCKEQADNKLHAIEKSKELEAKLTAQIKELTAEIAELETAISDLATKIEELTAKMKELDAERKETNEKYVKEEEDLSDAISACKKAIEVLKASKEEIKAGGGKVDLLAMLKGMKTSGEMSQGVVALLTARQTQDPTAYQYQSNDIIQTIRDLMLQFKGDKKELDAAEFASKAAFDKEHLGLSNQKKFAEKDKSEKEQLKEEKTEEKEKAQADYDAEVEARKADEGFLDELTTTCETKAKAWDERSKTRAAEITAITEAIEALRSGVKDNYESNKLAMLARQQRRGLTLLLQTGEDSAAQGVVRRLQAQLHDASLRLHSDSLATVAAKIGSQGNFDKVKTLIEDLIKKLEDEAKEEAEMKDFCNDKMSGALDKKEASKAEIEEFEATIVKNELEVKEAAADVETLSEEIAAGKKALLEATQLRQSEKDTNAKTLADANAGKAAVEEALSILKDFYGSGFLQVGKKAGEGPDRDGNTVSDLAPKTFEGEYEKKTEESGGIIAILELILGDFEKTIADTEAAEKTGEEEFEKFEKENGEDDEAKSKEKAEKEATIAELTDKNAELKDKVLSGQKAVSNSEEELRKLQAMCVFGADTYEEKVKRREEEIEALKGALKLLDEFNK